MIPKKERLGKHFFEIFYVNLLIFSGLPAPSCCILLLDCQSMKLPASVRPSAVLIQTSLPLFSVLWCSFLPAGVPSSPDARSRHISNGNPHRPAESPTHGCRTGAAFLSFTISPTSYTISSLLYSCLILRLHPPSTFPMVSLITRSA